MDPLIARDDLTDMRLVRIEGSVMLQIVQYFRSLFFDLALFCLKGGVALMEQSSAGSIPPDCSD